MTNLKKITYLNKLLLSEMPEYEKQGSQFEKSPKEQRRLLRSLMNVRPPMPLSQEFLTMQDELLQEEIEEKGIVEIAELTPLKGSTQLYLWQGDITRLRVDAIVNAANAALCGCFIPCHGCIDNAIHSMAGLQLRQVCDKLMKIQGHEEETGRAKITHAYNLPSKYVIHTVGPIIRGELTPKDCDLLASCYKECLKLASENKVNSIAFCCISTGEFHFPNEKAAQIAINTVINYIAENKINMEVIFNVFKEKDYDIYERLWSETRANESLS